MTRGAVAMEMDSDWVAVPPAESVATSLKVERPLVVGVPVISPVAGSILSPAGSEPVETDQV